MQPEKKSKTYKVSLHYNNEVHEKRTTDIQKAILSMRPDELYTEMYVVVSRNGSTIERKLTKQQGKNLFLQEHVLPIFINNFAVI